MRIVGIGVMVALGGCAGNPVAQTAPVKLIGSDFCKIQRQKLTWVPEDTRETIQGIRKFNKRWDSRCLKRRKPKTS